MAETAAQKKLIVRELLHPKVNKVVPILSELGKNDKPLAYANLVVLLKTAIKRYENEKNLIFLFYAQNKLIGSLSIAKAHALVNSLEAKKVAPETVNIRFLVDNKLLDMFQDSTGLVTKAVNQQIATQTLDDLADKVKILLINNSKKPKELTKNDFKISIENFNGQVIIENVLESNDELDIYYYLKQGENKSQVFLKHVTGILNKNLAFSEAQLASSRISEILQSTGFEATQSIKISTIKYKVPKWLYAILAATWVVLLFTIIILILSIARII